MSALSRHRRGHAHRAGMGAPVLKTTASRPRNGHAVGDAEIEPDVSISRMCTDMRADMRIAMCIAMRTDMRTIRMSIGMRTEMCTDGRGCTAGVNAGGHISYGILVMAY